VGKRNEIDSTVTMDIVVDTYETRRVVVTNGLGVTVRLQGRVGLHNLFFE